MSDTCTGTRTARSLLLTSAGVMSLTLGGIAQAQVADSTASRPSNSWLQAQGASTSVTRPGNDWLEAQNAGATVSGPSNEWLESQDNSRIKIDAVAPEPEILIANPNTPTDARDPTLITGIGQMVVDQGDGFIGLCTGTLINPRTVIFAAHCVNEQAANTYGANSGGTGIAFGFENNTRANAAGETDELVRWLRGGTGGAGLHQTNIAQSFYNANFVAYNPYSLEPESLGFLYGDVAMATLDTPAAKIPTWALMFSPLTNTGTIGAAGTGFNVNIVGYGNNGTGTAGAGGIDYRRRAAENILGALTDLQTFESALFGKPPSGLTQNLYFIDFDDPRRGMNTASPFDFNVFRDNAVASGKEGITSSGDSGGPLILTNFSKQVVIGVLSGGYTRFYAGQPANSYGTAAFYQPLYLYWDWIAANNPYHYVTATAGNGSWTDPNHWVTTLDPSYNILVGGQVVNGIPTSPGEQKNGTSGDFGQICDQSGGVSSCYDTHTGVVTVENRPIGQDATADPATAPAATVTTPSRIGGFDGVTREAQAGGVTTLALPPATLTNGLPGATNFVPTNVNPVRTTSTAGRYFDVTLASTGITTLTGANVTIDRLTLGTSGVQLVIDANASLTTLINTTQFAGFMTVNGTLTSVGDYSLMAGGLLGSGRINAPFVTSIMGQIAPGTTSAIGTLTVGGNLVLASGSSYLVNLGANGLSDRLAVAATTFAANGTTPTNGSANVGGQLGFSAATGTTPQAGNVYTILTAQGGVTGRFATPGSLSAILTPTVTYTPTAVQVTLAAGLYANVVAAGSPVQTAYARLLDQNRSNQSLLTALFTPLDLADAATIRTTLESLAPRTEQLNNSIGTAAIDNMGRFYRDRLASLQPGERGGTLAMTGQPLKLAALNMNRLPGQEEVRTDAGDTVMQQGQLPESVSGFLAGGYLDGHAQPLPNATPFGTRNEFDGYYIAAGLEADVGDHSVLGFSVSYTDIDGETAVAGDKATGHLYLGTIYGKTNLGSAALDAMFSAGALGTDTRRDATIVGTNYTLRTSSTSFAVSGEVGAGVNAELGAIKVGPRVAIRASRIMFDDTPEWGGGPALVYRRRTLDSLQARAGLTAGGGVGFRPHLSAYFVHDFDHAPASFGANFVGGIGPAAAFSLIGTDKSWVEVGGGIGFGSDKVEFSVGADTTIERKDVANQSYRASVKVRF